MVLLKNEHESLPLSKALHSIAVIGPLADDHRSPLGWWSGDGKPEDTVTPLTVLGRRCRLPTKVSYAKGCDTQGDSTEGFAEAVAIARDSDVAIVFVGEISGDGW